MVLSLSRDKLDDKQFDKVACELLREGKLYMYHRLSDIFYKESLKMVPCDWNVGKAPARMNWALQRLGNQTRHVEKDETKAIHIDRKYSGFSIDDLGYIFQRSSATIHSVLKKSIKIPTQSELMQRLPK